VSERILITGAAGGIGTALRPRMARPGRTLRLLDIAPLPAAADGEAVELLTADVTDLDAMRAACADVDAVIHLAGFSGERPYQDIHRVNIGGTYTVFEAARLAGVPRVVFASSNHAVGFAPIADGVIDNMPPRPDTYYGVSKVFGEAIGSLYHDRYGLDVIALRIGSCFERPSDVRMLSTWMSFDDCARLMEAALSTPEPGFALVWGVSANTRGWASLEAAKAIGYQPRDDAERYAAELLARDGELDPSRPETGLVGGRFTLPINDADRLGG
jgi:uronate dehydrogenase